VNYDEAIRWFGYSIAHRGGWGCFSMAGMYRDGKGFAKDEVKASEYFLKGAMLEHVDSQLELARRYLAGKGLAVDLVEACAWYDVAARKGDSDATVARDGMLRSFSSTQVSAARSRSDAIISLMKDEKAARRSP
jgi:TPR repeat protein